jgi:hypothetical protein
MPSLQLSAVGLVSAQALPSPTVGHRTGVFEDLRGAGSRQQPRDSVRGLQPGRARRWTPGGRQRGWSPGCHQRRPSRRSNPGRHGPGRRVSQGWPRAQAPSRFTTATVAAALAVCFACSLRDAFMHGGRRPPLQSMRLLLPPMAGQWEEIDGVAMPRRRPSRARLRWLQTSSDLMALRSHRPLHLQGGRRHPRRRLRPPVRTGRRSLSTQVDLCLAYADSGPNLLGCSPV